MRQGRLVFILSAWTVALLLLGSPRAHAQELEPNDSCQTAQDLGAAPLEVSGSLGSPDIDFFRLNNASGTAVITLEGSDPYLGVFNSDCVLLATDDDSGGGWNSRITIATPPDGILIVAATSHPDFGLTGNGYFPGPYTLKVGGDPDAVALSGRVADSRTGAGIAWASVVLYRCFDGYCYYYAGQTYSDFDGNFRFDRTFTYLPAGEYRLEVYANNYVGRIVGPFLLSAGEEKDLGDLFLDPVPYLRSISGRVVDSMTGEPVPGTAPFYASVELQYCYDEFYFCSTVRYAYPDSEGRFRFDGDASLPPGTYQVAAYADQYQVSFSDRFTVADQEDRDVGDVAIRSFPVRIYPAKVCGPIPSRGGTCQFSARLVNGMEDRLSAETWTLVQSGGFFGPFISFQTGLPKTVSLQSGESAEVPFSFVVPGEVSDGTSICLQTYVARKPHSFNVLGQHHLFCLGKGGGFFRVVPENEKREAVRRANGQSGNRKQ